MATVSLNSISGWPLQFTRNEDGSLLGHKHVSPSGAAAPSGPGPPHHRGFTITLRHTTLGTTPLDK
jgi:hypothetical protein